jgi:dTDP-4-amino-4,6-dideoxygalactose transaminase
MPEIMALAKAHGLAVIEDAAHAPGATLDGRALGTFGEIGCFSFFSNKNLPTGEGGMLVTDRDDLAAKLRLLRSHGMTSLTYDRHQGHAFSYDVVELGYNDRIDEIRASLGLTQLAKLADNNAQRRALTHAYWDALADLPLNLPFKAADQGTGAYHIFPILLPEGADRGAFMAGLRDAGVQSSIHYRPIHTFSYYVQRYGEQSLPVTEAAAAREVTLPLFPSMSGTQFEMVIEAVSKLLGES